jgi:nicotinamide mononucleotide adenylyltransferase
MTTNEERRTWSTPIRTPWNPIIHNLLKAIDHHNVLYFQTANKWHLEKAAMLRAYVDELKSWIHQEETNVATYRKGLGDQGGQE